MTATLPATLTAAVDDVLARLRAAGLQASLTFNELDPPGLLLSVPSIEFRYGKCWAATFVAWAVCPGLTRNEALGQLSDVLQRAADALGSPWATADADDMGPPTGGLLPAYRVEFTRKLPPPSDKR